MAAAQNGITAGKPWRADFFPDTWVEQGWRWDTEVTLMLPGLDIYPGWTHIPAGRQLLSGVQTDHMGKTGLPISMKQKDETVAFSSGRHIAKCPSLPPSQNPDSSTSELGFKAEFGSVAPSHLCCSTEINTAAQASSCYSEPVTFGLSIKLQTLRITSFVVIHVTNQSVQ